MNIQAEVEKIRSKFKGRFDFRTDEKGGKNALVYGLCAGEGIDTEGMRPREAWEAYIEKTGKTPDSVFVEKNMDKMDYSELHAVREHIRQKMYKALDYLKYKALLDTFSKLDGEIKKRDKEGYEKYQKERQKEKPEDKKAESEKPDTEPEKVGTPSAKASASTTAAKSTSPNGNEAKSSEGSSFGSSESIETTKKETPKNTAHPFSADAYSEERKNKALWSNRPAEVDAKIRGVCGEVWKNASDKERMSAIRYTKFAYGQFNDPLRKAGEKGDFSATSTDVAALTDLIDRSSYDFDMKLQRGTSPDGAAKFLGVDEKLLKSGNISALKKELIGTEAVEYGFTSTGAAEGYGSLPSDHPDDTIQYNIYAPKGTKMLYCEPFSWYNAENENPPDWDFYNPWDGERKAERFSREFEMLLQRNTRYRVTGVRKKDGLVWIDMEVVGQGDE